MPIAGDHTSPTPAVAGPEPADSRARGWGIPNPGVHMAEPTTNGRVSTRELLAAVEGAEDRITHRIDRMETKMDTRFEDHEDRLIAIETQQTVASRRNRDMVGFLAGIKSFILVAVAVISVAIGVISVTLATQPIEVSPTVHVTESSPQP